MRAFSPSESCKEIEFKALKAQSWLQVERGRLSEFSNDTSSSILNCPEAAMRSLQLAHQHALSDYERLVYEGWILYDTGHWEQGLKKADESIKLKRSFEAFFFKSLCISRIFPRPFFSYNCHFTSWRCLEVPLGLAAKGAGIEQSWKYIRRPWEPGNGSRLLHKCP